MSDARTTLARKYANAFLNCFIEDINLDEFYALCALELFLKSNQKILYFLSLSHIDSDIKKDFLHTLFEQFKVIAACNALARILIDNKRGQLLCGVLKQVIMIYRQRKKIVSFVIATSHHVPADQIAVIQQFLAHQIGCDIIYECVVDKKLIAGIRVQSDTLLWEYSIGKQLGLMSHKFTQ